MNIKKIIYTGFLILTIFVGLNASASTSSDKDNVLIYSNKTGAARGYDLMWKAPNITGTFAQESAIIRKDDIVYVTSILIDGMPGNKDIFALDAYTGNIITQYEIGPSFGDALIDGNTLYIATGGESWRPESTYAGNFGMYSFDISDVRNNGFVLNWFYEVANRIVPNYLLDANNIYFAEFEGDKYIALDRITGNPVWEFTKGYYGAAFEIMIGAHIYIANSALPGTDTLYKINKIDGTEVWNKPIIGKLWDNSLTYSVDDDTLFLTSYYDVTHRAASYDLDGNIIWTQPLNDASLSFTSYHNNSVFFSDLSGWVYSLNSATGAIEWSTQVGTAGNMITDIASPVIANGYVFIGTKGPGYEEGIGGGLADSRGRGAFYILDEQTGSIIWEYHEDDLGDIMALATITDGIFYNVTSAWDVYAFDIGDGTTSDHLISTYDTNNTFSTETGLTQNKYVEMICTNIGDESTCNTTNSYTGRAIEVKVDMDTDIVESVILANGNYHINVDGSYVYMPVVPASGSVTGTMIKSSGATVYDPTIPHLVNIIQNDAAVLQASYNPTNEKIVLSIDNTTVFDAEIEVFSKPFIGVTSTLDNSSVVISKTGMSGVTSIISADMLLTESVGDNQVNVSRWDTDYKRWTEKGTDAANISSHIIDGLTPNKEYILIIDGNSRNIVADGNGEISFDEFISDGFHDFILKLYKKSKSGSSIKYVCKDEAASNYSSFGRHKQSKCEYDSMEGNNEESGEVEANQSNPFGGEQCPSNLLIHDFMKNGDTNGVYSNYNKGAITEVSILQAHINRLLAGDYTQAAGPVDIWFRSLTHRGVERIQVKLNQLLPNMVPLVVDGVVGPFTREAINMSC